MKEKFITTNELANDASKILKGLNRSESVIILRYSRPVGALISYDDYKKVENREMDFVQECKSCLSVSKRIDMFKKEVHDFPTSIFIFIAQHSEMIKEELKRSLTDVASGFAASIGLLGKVSERDKLGMLKTIAEVKTILNKVGKNSKALVEKVNSLIDDAISIEIIIKDKL